MKHLIRATIIITTWLVLAACSQSDTVDFTKSGLQQLGVENLQVISATSVVAGQPTQEQLEALAEAGVKHVINLRPASELDWDEQSVVKSLGMEYHSIAVAGKPGVTVANARALDALLDQLEGEPLLLHCSSSNRVGSLIALRAHYIDGQSVDTAISKGRAWGLTRLEPFVREKMTQVPSRPE